MTLFIVAVVTPWSATGAEFVRGLAWSFGLGAGIGLLVGALRLLYRRIDWDEMEYRQRVKRIFDGDPRVMPPPPAEATHRMICGFVTVSGEGVGGALYVLPTGLTFHSFWYRRRFWYLRTGPSHIRHEWDFGPPRTITLRNEQITLQGKGRRGRPRSLLALACSSESGKGYLLVRHSDEAVARLQLCVDALREATA